MPAWQIFLAWKLESVLVLFSKNLERLSSVSIPETGKKGKLSNTKGYQSYGHRVIQDQLPHFGFHMVQTSTQGRLWGHRRQQTAFKSCTKSDQMKLQSGNSARIGPGVGRLWDSEATVILDFGDLYLPSIACNANRAARVSKQGRLTWMRVKIVWNITRQNKFIKLIHWASIILPYFRPVPTSCLFLPPCRCSALREPPCWKPGGCSTTRFIPELVGKSLGDSPCWMAKAPSPACLLYIYIHIYMSSYQPSDFSVATWKWRSRTATPKRAGFARPEVLIFDLDLNGTPRVFIFWSRLQPSHSMSESLAKPHRQRKSWYRNYWAPHFIHPTQAYWPLDSLSKVKKVGGSWLEMDTWWTPDRHLMDTWWTPDGYLNHP